MCLSARPSRRFLLAGVYARGKRPYAGKGKKPTMDSLILEKENSENKPLLCLS